MLSIESTLTQGRLGDDGHLDDNAAQIDDDHLLDGYHHHHLNGNNGQLGDDHHDHYGAGNELTIKRFILKK